MQVGRVGPAGRREVGHGMLAERALAPAVPSQEEFPYIVRLESNITESNGSSSMASVCGGCLSMLDAGARRFRRRPLRATRTSCDLLTGSKHLKFPLLAPPTSMVRRESCRCSIPAAVPQACH